MDKYLEPKIVNIFWKRTYLFIEYEYKEINALYLDDGKSIFYPECRQIGENKYRVRINVCNQNNGQMLSDGIMNIVLGDSYHFDISDDVLMNIESVSAVFRYDENKAYIVTFNVPLTSTGETGLELKIDYMKKNKRHKSRYDKLFVLKKVLNMYYKIIRIFDSKKGNRILFLSENSDVMTGNMKAIYNRIIARGLIKKYEVRSRIENIVVNGSTWRYWLNTVAAIAKSDYIFVDDYVPIFSFLHIDKRTCLIQTWHAGFGYKSVGYGRFGLEGSPNPHHSCHREYTYALVGNKHLKEIYAEVFGIDNTALLPTGMPRLDSFLEKEKISRTKKLFFEKCPEFTDKEIIIFAPTYRGSNQNTAYYDFDKIDQQKLYDYCKSRNAVVLFKFHHFIKDKMTINEEYKECLYDFSECSTEPPFDLHSLFYISDVLITDYSSCFYDYLLLEKPVIFYIYDEAVFTATRGVHRPVSKTAPGFICKSMDELIDTLKTEEYKKNNEVPESLIDATKTNVGRTASDKVIDYILLGKRCL